MPGEVTMSGRTLSIGTEEPIVGKETIESLGEAPEVTGEAVITLDGHVFTAIEDGKEAVLGSVTISSGELTTVGGETVSFGSGGLIFDGSTMRVAKNSGETVQAFSSATSTLGSGVGDGDGSPGVTHTSVSGSKVRCCVGPGRGWRWNLLVFIAFWVCS